MDPKVQEQLDEQEIKINQIYESVKKTERYMRWTFWGTVGVVILPIVIGMILIPMLLSSFSSSLDSGSLNEVMQVYGL